MLQSDILFEMNSDIFGKFVFMKGIKNINCFFKTDELLYELSSSERLCSLLSKFRWWVWRHPTSGVSCYLYCCVLEVSGFLYSLDSYNSIQLALWLSQRQCDSGGFNGRPEKQADVCYSWWVLATLAIIGKMGWINKQLLTEFILYCQDPEGGIADRPDNVGDIFHTFFGFAGLSLLGQLKEIQSNEIDPAYALPKRLLVRLNLI